MSAFQIIVYPVCVCVFPFQIFHNLTGSHQPVMASLHFKTLRTQNSSCATISINNMAVELNFQEAAEEALFKLGS